jgi:branched-chain amino acid transport system substrate-binding protein
MGENFASGLEIYRETFINNRLSNVQFICRETGVGPGKALKMARILIEEEGVNLITGIIDPGLNPDLVDLCMEKRIYLIANHTGANLSVVNPDKQYIIQNSLQYWQSNWAMGFWAAQNIGRSVVIAASFYESGYDALYAFSHGFENGGGLVLETVINNRPNAPDDHYAPIISINHHKPDLIFASYSGPEAVEFIRNYQAAGLSSRIPLVTSGFTVDESILASLGSAAAGIKSALSWTPDLKSEANDLLKRSFRRKNGKAADTFAVMGYETGQTIEQLIDRQNFIARSVSAILTSGTPSGPRMRRASNPDPASTDFPIYLREVKRVNGRYQNSTVAELKNVVSGSAQYELASAGPKTGWLNAYLCV